MTPDDLPLLLSAPANAKRARRLADALGALREGKAAGSIPSARFVEAKDALARAVDDAWTHVQHDHGMGPLRELDSRASDWMIRAPMVNGVAPFGRALSKWLADFPESVRPFAVRCIAFANEVKAVGALLDEMKAKVVKRQAATSEERATRFQPPAVSGEAARRVRDVLTATVDGQFEALVAAFERGFKAEIAAFVRKRDKRLVEIAASDKPGRCYPLSFYLRETRFADGAFLARVLADDHGRGTPQLRPDAERIVAEQARAEAEAVRDLFVAKNLRKIASVVEAKERESAMTVCKALAHTVSLAGLSGTFRVAFADGSGFDFANSVVFKTSPLGKRFNQFPLTFHDVVLADGTKMPRPSEERMNAVFAKLAPEAA